MLTIVLLVTIISNGVIALELMSQLNSSRVLFVLAHPDDEVMFMLPTIQSFLKTNISIYFLYFTNGDSEGLGILREKELKSVFYQFQIPISFLYILHYPQFQDSFTSSWNTTFGVFILDKFIRKIYPTDIYTFDQMGVSQHPNHKAVFTIIHYYSQISQFPIQYHYLVSEQLIYKYSGILSILFKSKIKEQYELLDLPTVWKSMKLHASQFTCYSYVNRWITL